MDKIKKVTFLVTLLALVSKLNGLFRDILTAKVYGTSYIADSYNVAYIIVIIIFGLLNSALYNSLIPIFTEERNNEGNNDRLFRLINNLTNITFIVSAFIIIFGNSFSKLLVQIIATKADYNTKVLAAELLKVSLFSIIFLFLNSILSAALRVLNEFFFSALGSVLFAIPNIVFLIFFSKYGVNVYMATTVVGYIIQAIILYPKLRKFGYRYKLYLNLKDKSLKKIIKLAPPIIISSGMIQINSIVNNNVASAFNEGSITALSIASKLNGLVFTVVGTTIVTILYPIITQKYCEGNRRGFNKIINYSVDLLQYVMIPTTVIMVLFAKEIVKILFMRGAFTESSVEITVEVLIFYTLGLTFYVIRDIYNSAYYAMNDTSTPMFICFIGVSSNIILSLILPRFMGIGGISLSNAIAAMINCIILKYVLIKKYNVEQKWVNNDSIKVILSAICMAASILILKDKFNINNIVELILACGGSLVIYLVVTAILKHHIINEYKVRLLNKFINKDIKAS